MMTIISDWTSFVKYYLLYLDRQKKRGTEVPLNSILDSRVILH